MILKNPLLLSLLALLSLASALPTSPKDASPAPPYMCPAVCREVEPVCEAGFVSSSSLRYIRGCSGRC